MARAVALVSPVRGFTWRPSRDLLVFSAISDGTQRPQRCWNDIWLNPAFRLWSISKELMSIRKRLLAIQGRDDNYGTMAQFDAIAERVPQARLVKLDHCGHSPHRDAPGALNDAIASFIQVRS
jgi:pimeloyl-ACP methyl ester carboxylesterase